MMISVEKLNKRFGKFHALKDININVVEGEIYGFLGHNGAGKSTTINILTGLSKLTSGRCVVNGYDLSEAFHPGSLNIGYLPEEPKFYPWFTATETLKYVSSARYKHVSKKSVEEVLDWIGLTSAANRRVGGYSRGMKQRLGIGIALINNPELLLLDEPSSALDPQGRSDVLKLIMDLKERGKTVFFSTHILSDVERVCDRVAILKKGEMVLEKHLSILLKENVVPVFDVKLNDACPLFIVERLGQIPGVVKVECKNNTLSVWVEDVDISSNRVLESITSAQLPVRSFNTRTKNLEDIFLEEVKEK